MERICQVLGWVLGIQVKDLDTQEWHPEVVGQGHCA